MQRILIQCRPARPKRLALLFVAAALIAAASPAAAAVNEESLGYHQEAMDYLSQGDINAAVIQLKNAIRADVSNLEARYDLGLVYFRIGDPISAEKELRAAREGGFGAEDLDFRIAQAMLMQSKPREVLDEITAEGKEGPVRAEILAARAQAHLLLGDRDAAEVALRTALDAAPAHAQVRLAYSAFLAEEGDYAASEREVDAALAASPDLREALLQKGRLRQQANDPLGAIPFYGRVLDANPQDPGAHLGRAAAYAAIDAEESALSDLNFVLKRAPQNVVANYLKALMLARRGQDHYQEALDTLIATPNIESYTPALYLLGSLRYASGELAQAEEYTRAFLARTPDDRAGTILLGVIYLRQNRPQDAILLLEPLYEENPETLTLADLLGQAHMAAGNFAEATMLFEKAATLEPGNVDNRLRLIQSELGGGDRESAIAGLEALIEEDPAATRPYAVLIVLHLQAGALEEADAVAERLRAAAPESPLGDNFIASVALARNDREAARQHLEAALAKDPGFYPAAINLARVEMAQGQFDRAETRLRALLADNPDNIDIHMALAEVARLEDDFDRELNWLEQAAERAPNAAQPRIRIVNRLLEEDAADRALVAARELATVAPESPEALLALARAQSAVGQQASAIASYRRLALMLPDSAQIQMAIGQTEAALDNFNDAAVAFERAIDLAPDVMDARLARLQMETLLAGPEATIRLAEQMAQSIDRADRGAFLVGEALMTAGRPAEAAARFEAARDAAPEQVYVHRLHASLVAANRAGEAREAVETWLAQNPDDTATRFILAASLIEAGEYGRAIAESERILERTPDNAAVLNNVAWLYDHEGEPAKALERAERAYALAPSSPEIADTLGWMLVARGDLDRGLALLRAAHEGAPGHAEIGYHFAVALDRAGSPEEALGVLDSVMRGGADFASADEARALQARLRLN